MLDPAPPARRPRRAPFASAIVALVVLAGACVGTTPTGQTIRSDATRDARDDALIPSTVDAANGFAVDLFRVSASGRGNVVAGTFPVMLALGMARAGSAGATRDQFDAVLHARETPDLDAGLNTVDQVLATRNGEQSSPTRKGRVTLSFEASVWGQRGTRFDPDYLDVLAADYDQPMRVVDFRSDPDTARDAINQWASDATRGRIPEVVPRGDVPEQSRFLPAAVTYLRAPWQVPFDEDVTRSGPFLRADGSAVDVRTMQVSARSGILSSERPGWTAVDIPYLGNGLSLLVIQPTAGTFEAFRDAIDHDEVDRIVDDLDDRPVVLRLPQFQFTTDGDLTEELEALGLTDAFSRSADLSGITTDEVLELDGMASHGYFGIDEQGTEAETTADVAEPEPVLPAAPRITVGGPFVFALRDRETGLILLMGQVVSP